MVATEDGPLRILVIEDEARIRSFLARGLEAEGYSVEGAADGRAGLALALGASWDLVVLDLLLPGLGGLDVLRELHRERPAVPVLVVSARSDLPTKLRGFELGATDYLPKPFSLAELLARVRVQLRKTASSEEVGNLVRGVRLTLDLARRQVRFDGTICDLADREFRLLHHLLLHEGEVVSRERLLADVWGYGFHPGSNVVDVSVRRLRKKLGPDAPIQTVRNAGYRLVA
jgi:two-component system copper resistance phosphate regulon response regulator CusR